MEIKKIDFTDDNFLKVKNVRFTVFQDEMGIPESKIFDEYDITSEHFVFIHELVVIGSVRLRETENNIKLERMAIYQKYRKKNFGIDAISKIIKNYKNKKFEKIILDSIYDVRNFYKKCGFVEIGKVFDRVGFPHIRMELPL